MTLGEYLQIYSDIDAYLARGGKLPPEAERLLDRVATHAQKAGFVRWGLFLAALGARTPDGRIGEVCSERDLRRLWDMVKKTGGEEMSKH